MSESTSETAPQRQDDMEIVDQWLREPDLSEEDRRALVDLLDKQGIDLVDEEAMRHLDEAEAGLKEIKAAAQPKLLEPAKPRITGLDPATGVAMVGNEKPNLPYETGRRA